MPIAILLQEITAAFRYGARVLDPWNHLVMVEELLIDRARSAFLFKWFGTGLPLHGFHVRVAIVNIEELRQRYLKVQEEARQRAEGPNLTEPLFGMAGVAVGMLLTPGVAIGSAIAVVRSLAWHATTFLEVLKEIGLRVLILAGSLLGPAVVALSPLLAAGSFVGYLQMGVANAPGLRAIFDLLGGLARLLAAATKFIRLLLGPRSEVKNPILAGLLHLFDQLAKVFPFGLALIAVFVARFGPLLIPIAATITALSGLVSTIFDTLTFIFNNFVEQLKAVFTGPQNVVSPMQFMLDRLTAVFSKIVPTFNALLDTATDILERWSKDVRKQVKDWGKALGTNLENLIKQDPTWVKAERLFDALTLAGAMLGRASTTPSTTPSTSSKPSPFDPWIAQAEQWAAEAEKVIKSAPELPTIETPGAMMERLGLETQYGIPKDMEKYKAEVKSGLPPVSEPVTRYVERARHPASAFAYEQKALAAAYGAKTPQEALEKAHAEELELRGTIEAVVGRVLPPELRVLMIPLGETFEAFDQTVTLDQKKPKKKAAKRQFPVKDLPEDNGRLRPVVQRLVVHSKSGRREDLRDFLEQLQKKLDRPYPATV